MHCPFCSAIDTRVIDSRLVGAGDKVRRRRQCVECEERYTTYESAELNYPRIIKSDGRRQKFEEDKLRSSLLRALEKRPVSIETIEMVISRLSHKLRALGLREVKSKKLGEWAMEELREMDQVAYIRFASVYRSFNHVREFFNEIENLESDTPKENEEGQLDLLSKDKEKT